MSGDADSMLTLLMQMPMPLPIPMGTQTMLLPLLLIPMSTHANDRVSANGGNFSGEGGLVGNGLAWPEKIEDKRQDIGHVWDMSSNLL